MSAKKSNNNVHSNSKHLHGKNVFLDGRGVIGSIYFLPHVVVELPQQVESLIYMEARVSKRQR